MAFRRCWVAIYDRRKEGGPPLHFNLSHCNNYNDFRKQVAEKFAIGADEEFVICNTNRTVISEGEIYSTIEAGETLYILVNASQVLPACTREKVQYLPHYDTLVKSGMYEYYASEGQNPLPYAFAELIDNALTATVDTIGLRKIEIRLMLDENSDKSTIFVIDNGCGMTSYELNNWAIYRLSKFNRKDKASRRDSSGFLRLPPAHNCPRFLNSQISYFGVGGKQAAFYIGDSARMITKSKCSHDVHEMCISREAFEEKEKNNEFVYDGEIINRNPGDFSHCSPEDEYIRKVIAEEVAKESFTCVILQGISQDHVAFLRHNFKVWCCQLAHIYHYYIHGPEGNVDSKNNAEKMSKLPLTQLSIEVNLFNRGVLSKSLKLADIDDDQQTLFIRSSVSSFDFKAIVEGTGIVEGVIRYHPFLYDRETYPKDASDSSFFEDENEGDESRALQSRRPVFECFWNGRLIPYTSVDDFDWCSLSRRNKNIPEECYNRISGVLWTNDVFEVSTNKLTYIDMEVKLRDKSTIFRRILNNQEKRGNIDKQFTEWLLKCHAKYDKQICFSDFQELISRADLPKIKQYPWSSFACIEWDSHIFKSGQLVKLHRVTNVHYGSVKRFLLYGEYTQDVYSTGGFVEWFQEPKSLYGDAKIHPISKLDRHTTEEFVQKWIEGEEEKLLDKLIISWPDGDTVTPGCKIPAGRTIGALKVEIANRKGELVSKLPGSNQRKLLVELKIVWHSSSGDVTIVNHLCHYAKTWSYWFKKMENIKNLGLYSLKLQVVLNESGSASFNGNDLPSLQINFTVTEAEAKKFTIGILDGPFLVGVPFQIPLEFQDKFGNSTKPCKMCAPVLAASGLDIEYEDVKSKGNSLIIKNITAIGTVDSNSGKNFMLSVTIPELDNIVQSLKIRMLPGPPRRLRLMPTDGDLEIENGQKVNLEIQVQDAAGNNASCLKLFIMCKFISRFENLPVYSGYCNATGQATLSGSPIKVANITGPDTLKAVVEVQNAKHISSEEKNITLLPSSKAARVEMFYTDGQGEKKEIGLERDLTYQAGEVVSNIKFLLYDEANRIIKISHQLASKIKVDVNWVPRLKLEMVMRGDLPYIKVPSSVTDIKYCSMTVGVNKLDFHFAIRPLPGDPVSLQCSFDNGKPSLRLGMTLASSLRVTPVDKHGNAAKKVVDSDLVDISVSSDRLDLSKLVKRVGQDDEFVIDGLTFNGGSLGEKEIGVQWNDILAHIWVTVLPGVPSKIILPNLASGDNEAAVISVVNGSQLSTPFIVEVLDGFGNACKEANLKVYLTYDSNLKISPAPQPCKTNKQSKANFGLFSVSVKPGTAVKTCSENVCSSNCFGVFGLTPNVEFNRKVITGQLVKFHVICDYTKPVRLSVIYEEDVKCVAGEELPEFKVCVLAEDGLPLNKVSSSKMFMDIWYGSGTKDKNSRSVVTFSPSQNACDEQGSFHFKKFCAPEISGVHNIQFTYKIDNEKVESSVISLLVVASSPAKLISERLVETPIVSNTAEIANRTLIKKLRLDVIDKYDNKVGVGFHGKMNVNLVSNRELIELPVFANGLKSVDFSINDGHVIIQNLMIKENSPGVDGEKYCLDCIASVTGLQKKPITLSYQIPFLFYNDVAKQSQMASLTKDRDILVHAIETYKSFFETSHQLTQQWIAAVEKTINEERKLRTKLLKTGLSCDELSSLSSISSCIEKKSLQKMEIERSPRRRCGLKAVPKDPDVLGKVAYLAEVEDDNVARILSWHMASNMDCVITRTTEKAMEIHRKMEGSQEVLALDSINRRSVHGWNKMLPHVSTKLNLKLSGNPVYARDLLIFPADLDVCKEVFMLFLGDAIIFDTLEDATLYRRELVKYVQCPTLLTRNGDRVLSSGKFGGQHNRAPSIDKLRGAVFGKPMPVEYQTIVSLIDTLHFYKSSMERREEAERQLSIHQKDQSSREMLKQRQEFKEKEQQLAELDKKLSILARPIIEQEADLQFSRHSREESFASGKRHRYSGNAKTDTVLGADMTGELQTSSRHLDFCSEFVAEIVPFATSTPRNLRKRTQPPVVSSERKRART